MSAEKKSTLINSISNWLKLLALIVLVAEAFLIAAMSMTDKTDPMRTWYPVLMILLLLIIIIGLFIDRRHDRNTATEQLQLRIDNLELLYNLKQSSASADLAANANANLFHDSSLGIIFELHDKNGWHIEPKMKYKDLMVHMGVIKEEDWPEVKRNMELLPVQKMMGCASVLHLKYGNAVQLTFNPDSTTPPAEKLIRNYTRMQKEAGIDVTDEDISAMRSEILNANNGFQFLNVENSFTVLRLNKKDASDPDVNIAHVFMSIQVVIKEAIEKLTANKDVILWASTFKALNVSVDGKKSSDITIYRMTGLIERDDHYYILQIQWCPQTNAAIAVWEQLKKMFETFKVTA